MQVPAPTSARVEWRFFNEAALARAALLSRLAADVPRAAAAPAAHAPQPVDWLRRAFAIAVVILAAGLAASVVLWAIRPVPSPPQVQELVAKDPAPAGDRSLPEQGVPAAVTAAPAPEIPAPQARVVTNFVRFTNVTVGDLHVSSGWRYSSSEDTTPAFQWCHAYPSQRPGRLSGVFVVIADSDGVQPYDPQAMAPLTRDQHRRALGVCAWAPGTEPARTSQR
jgi:hypothetical protein